MQVFTTSPVSGRRFFWLKTSWRFLAWFVKCCNYCWGSSPTLFVCGWVGGQQAVLTLQGSPSVQRARARLIRACATSSCRCLHAQLVITSESICSTQALREHRFASNNSAVWTLVPSRSPSLLHSSPPFCTSPPPPPRSSFQHSFSPLLFLFFRFSFTSSGAAATKSPT